MHDIDMIPAEYQRQRWLKRTLRNFLLLFGLLLLMIALGRSWLGLQISQQENEIAQLEQGESKVLGQRQMLDELEVQKQDLNARLTVLDALRGGPSARTVFQIIENAINPETWFVAWTFSRHKEVPKAEQTGVNTGYFIIVAQEKKPSRNEPWRNGTRLEIKGQGLSHASMAAVVKRLLLDPKVSDVHILNTATRQYLKGKIVAFELAVVLEHQGGGT